MTEVARLREEGDEIRGGMAHRRPPQSPILGTRWYRESQSQIYCCCVISNERAEHVLKSPTYVLLISVPHKGRRPSIYHAIPIAG